MVKRIGIALVAICCMASLSVAFWGCADNKAGFVGSWSLESGSEQTLDESTVMLMKSVGYSITLDLKEDGTGSLDLAGDVTNVTWEAKSATEGTASVEGGISGMLKLSDGKLVLEDGNGSSMTFVKGGSSSPSSAAS